MKKLISLLLSAVLAASMAAPALAANERAFSDVKKGSWYYDSVMAMTRVGLFKGKTYETDDRLATFDPMGAMTRAEFIKVLTTYLCGCVPGVAEPYWYSTYEAEARRQGLISDADFTDTLDAPCTREEMAYLLINTVKTFCESVGAVDGGYIPDYDSISPSYREAVRQTVYLGLITGKDDAHTFAPKATMTRAEAATVVSRLVEPTIWAVGVSGLRSAAKESYWAGEAGSYVSDESLASAEIRPRPTLDRSDSLENARNKLSGFVFDTYGYRFSEYGIAHLHFMSGEVAQILKSDDGQWGLRVFGWRDNYDTHNGINSQLNTALEAMRYLSGDKQLASALWRVLDYMYIFGSDATTPALIETFGFTVSNETETSIDLSMNGQTVHWTWGTGMGNYFYFD